MQLPANTPVQSRAVLDKDRVLRDLTTRPIVELITLRRAVQTAVLGTCGVGLLTALAPCFVYPIHAYVAALGMAIALFAGVGATMLARQPACRVVWGNHRVLNDVVHRGASIGMFAWVFVFASSAVSRAATTINSTAPQWLTFGKDCTWWFFIPCFVVGLFGIACVSELLATIARAGQADDAAERLRFSFLALIAALVFGIPMWWAILVMWGGPGMIVAVGAGLFVVLLLSRFMSGFLPLLGLIKWAVINAEDAVGHERRRLEQMAQRVRVLSEDDAATHESTKKPAARRQTQAWAKPVFKGSNRIEKDGEKPE
jgi:hypothetical protein